MSPWVQLLVNGMFLVFVAFAVLRAFKDAVTAFGREAAADRATSREIMAAERQATQTQWTAYMDLKMRQHEQLITAIAAQDHVLQEILSNQQKMMGGLHEPVCPLPGDVP